jgi:hypothetical protein
VGFQPRPSTGSFDLVRSRFWLARKLRQRTVLKDVSHRIARFLHKRLKSTLPDIDAIRTLPIARTARTRCQRKWSIQYANDIGNRYGSRIAHQSIAALCAAAAFDDTLVA